MSTYSSNLRIELPTSGTQAQGYKSKWQDIPVEKEIVNKPVFVDVFSEGKF